MRLPVRPRRALTLRMDAISAPLWRAALILRGAIPQTVNRMRPLKLARYLVALTKTQKENT